jgi:hypothetical protein
MNYVPGNIDTSSFYTFHEALYVPFNHRMEMKIPVGWLPYTDEDPHFVGLVEGWSAPVNPVDIGLYRIAGTDDVPGGARISVLFDTPGLYYYYCRNHDQVDPLTHRARALPMASEYPIPMEGFVLVV